MDLEIAALERFVISEDKSSALAEVPDSCSFKKYLTMSLEIDNEDLLEKLKYEKDLSEQEKSKLKALHLIKNLENNRNLDKTFEELAKFLKISFDYSPPKGVLSNIGSSYPSVLDQSVFLMDYSKMHQEKEYFNPTKPYARKKLNPLDMSSDVFQCFMQNRVEALGHRNTIRLLAEEFKSSKSINKEVLRAMRLDQLEEFEEIAPESLIHTDFILIKLSKKYDFSTKDYRDLYFQLNNFYEDAKSTKVEGLICTALLNLLSIGPKLGIIDEGLLQEYFLYHRPSPIYITQAVSTKSINLFLKFQTNIPEENLLLSLYFDELFPTKTSYQEYYCHIHSVELEKFIARAKILAGDDISFHIDKIPTNNLKTLEQLKILVPMDNNPTSFSQSDLVKIQMKIKGIAMLNVKVIELNTKSYYLERMEEISTDIDLDGLVGIEESQYVYEEGAMKISIKAFDFPILTGRLGFFVIEFIGSGVHSRVLIKKGGLRYTSWPSFGGDIIAIFDDNNKPIEQGGAFVDGKLFPIRNNCVIVPYAQATKVKKIILTNEHIYEIANYTHLIEEIVLKCSYLVHDEQLVLGKSTDIFIKPVLYINSARCPEYFIKSLQANISITDIEGLTTSKLFNNLNYSEDSIKLNIIIPARPGSIEILVTVVVEIRGETKEFTSKYKTGVNKAKKDALYQGYLRLERCGYVLEIRGRNGEPWKSVEGEFKFSLKEFNREIDSKLASDEHGKIYLGRLKGVNSFRCVFKDFSFSYNLHTIRPSISYPDQICLCESDTLTLPVYSKHPKSIDLIASLIQLKKGEPYRDFTSSLSVHEEKLSIKQIEKGDYLLKIHKYEKSIKISVIDGVHWGTKNEFILSESSVYSVKGQYDSFSMTLIEESPENLTMKLSCHHNLPMISVLYCNYISDTLQNHQKLLAQSQERPSSSHFQFLKPQNMYPISRLLDDEYRYILERKNFPGFIGNTLPRPQISVKRQALGDAESSTQPRTTAVDGHRSTTTAYSYDKGVRSQANQEITGIIKSEGLGYDFLDTNAKWMNIKVNGDSFEIPKEKGYGILWIAACNEYQNYSRMVILEDMPRIRDLTVKNVLSSQDVFIEKNSCESLKEGEELLLKNCESSFELIDDLEKLFSIQNSLGKFPEYSSWKFLTCWDSLSNLEKERKYEEFMSHELNLFLFKKDPEYFHSVIRPLLACKMQKTLVDKFLLSESLEPYVKSWQLLNTLEKVLLINWLSSINSSKAGVFAQDLINKANSIPLPPYRKDIIYKTVFQQSKTTKDPPPPPPQADDFSIRQALIGTSESLVTESRYEQNLEFYEHVNQSKSRLGMVTAPLHKSSKIPRSNGPRLEALKEKILLRYRKLESKNQCDESSSDDSSCNPPIGPSVHDLMQSINTPAFYHKLDSTKEYIETNYYNYKSLSDSPTIPVTKYWADLALQIVSGGESYLLSESLLYCTSSIAEQIFALSFSSLPFNSQSSLYQTEGKSLRITAGNCLLVFYKEIVPVQAEITGEILAAHRYFKPDDKYMRTASGAKIEKTVRNLVKQTIYECNLVITNVSGQHKSVNVLQLAPEGSIPIAPPINSRNLSIELEAYTTNIINYTFYFPQSGIFEFFPASISEENRVIALATTDSLEVTEHERIENSENLSDIVISGDNQKIFEYLEKKNPYSKEYRLDLLYYKLKDKEFYTKVIEILKSREILDRYVYNFSLLHRDVETAKILFQKLSQFTELFKYTPSPLFTLESFKHHEYNPLVNARAHKLGQNDRIANPRIKEVYRLLLLSLIEKPCLSLCDKLQICQYLIYQDKQEQALQIFNSALTDETRVSYDSPGSSELQIQIDYMGSYLDQEIAARVVSLYENYPVKHWRKMFKDISQVLKEREMLDSDGISLVTMEEPTINFVVEDSAIKVNYINVKSCVIRFYLVDLEVLFSRNPFLMSSSSNFSYSKPAREIIYALDISGKEEIKLPEEFLNKNVILELDCNTYVKSLTYFATGLKATVIEMQGVVRVTSKDGNTKAGVYVKIYARYLGGKVVFYKDGFTDLRGKFNYASLNTDSLANVQRFAIMIDDANLGALVLEANPPPQ